MSGSWWSEKFGKIVVCMNSVGVKVMVVCNDDVIFCSRIFKYILDGRFVRFFFVVLEVVFERVRECGSFV